MDWFPVWLSLRVALLASAVTVVVGYPWPGCLPADDFPGAT